MMGVLMESALRALVVALAVGSGLRLFRVGSVAAQKIAWALVLVCAVAMPAAMRWPGLEGLLTVHLPAALAWTPATAAPMRRAAPEVAAPAHPWRRAESAKPLRFVETESALPGGGGFSAPVMTPGILAGRVNQQVETGSMAATTGSRLTAARDAALRLAANITLAASIYLAVCALLLLRMLCGLAMAWRLWLKAERFEPEPGPDPLADPGRGLRLRFSFAVASPVTIGSGVLLPADCLRWDREKLRIVLAHERAHVRQGDFYLQLGAGLYAAVFWFSPLGWWLKRTLSDLGEAISDRAGLEQAASRVSYAQVLLEFAAMPRPTLIGVAMARNSNLAQRMERFLNESQFRRAFSGGKGRTLLAVLLVPAALLAGTALVRVEAAPGRPMQAPPAAATAASPAMAPIAALPSAPAPADDQAVPAPAAAPDPAPAPQAAPVAPAAPNAEPPAPPEPAGAGEADEEHSVTVNSSQDNGESSSRTVINGKHWGSGTGVGYSYSYSSDGDSWALVTNPSGDVTFSGDWNAGTRGQLEEARKMAGGKFLWFTHNGRSYLLNDAALVAQIEAMYKPLDDLGREQEKLGKEQEELGRQQEALGRLQEQANIPTPDISKEMARLNEAVAKLNAKKGSTVSQDELADLEGKLGELQGRLGELQGEMGAKQGEIGERQGSLGEQQGKLGEQQGRLGEQQGKLAAEANRRVKSIIDQSLRNGKARPVE